MKKSMDKPLHKSTPLYHGYLLKSKVANFSLRIIDFWLNLFFGRRTKVHAIERPVCRILLSNIAHLGDLIVATSLLPVVKQNFPQAKIGFLIASWSKSILENHPLVDEVYYFDHALLNRSDQSFFKKLWQHFKTRKAAICAIKKANYDVAIDLYFSFPNAIPLFYKCHVPERVGFTSGGFGALLTHRKIWQLKQQQLAYYHLDLLRFVFPYLVWDGALHAVLPQNSSIKLGGFLPPVCMQQGYLVVHTGAGRSIRNWPNEKWLCLKEALLKKGYVLVFTGKGMDQQNNINKILAGNHTNCFNVADRLPFSAFVEVIRHARGVVSVDTSSIHIAAAVDTPVVVIGHGMHNPVFWGPLSGQARYLTADLPCIPCYSTRCCKHISCFRTIKIEAVMEALEALL